MISKVFAQQNLEDIYDPGSALGGTGAEVSTLAAPLVTNIMFISGLFAFFIIIFAGFQYITSSGDKNKVAQAQNMLNYGIIGLILVISSYLLTRLVGALLGFPLVN